MIKAAPSLPLTKAIASTVASHFRASQRVLQNLHRASLLAQGLVGAGERDRGQNFCIGIPLAAESLHRLLPVGGSLTESTNLECALPLIEEGLGIRAHPSGRADQGQQQ